MEKENNLARLREQRGMTQKEVAEALDVSRQAVSQWERGAAMPSMEKLLALSRLYGAAPEELYWRDTAEKAEGPEVPPEEPQIETGVEEQEILLEESMPEDETAPETSQAKAKRFHQRKKLVAAVFIVLIFGGILLWGRVTNSWTHAQNYLIVGILVLIVGWFLYLSYQILKYIRRDDPK